MKPSRFNRFTSLMTVAFLLSGPVFALDFQWDPNGATTGLGGAGTWNTTNAFWDDTASGLNDGTDVTTATTFTTADKAIFGGTGGAVAVGTPVSLNHLSVDTTGYSFTGSKITFGGTAATLTANADFTIANAIGGDFNKVGTGAVTITGQTTANTVTVSAGTLTRQASIDNDSSASIVNGGTLILASTTANSTSSVTLNTGTVRLNGTNDVQIWNGGTLKINGGTFEQNGKNETVGGLILNGGSITGAGILTSNTVIDARSGSSATILAGSVGLTKTTSGIVTLSGANSYTGVTNVSAGTIKVGNSTAFGTVNTAVTKVVVASGAAVDFNGQIDATYGYTISGTGVGATGALTNSGGAIGTGTKQATNIKLAANASIGGTGDWALLAAGYAATSLDLNAQTLTKTGANTVTLVNTTTTAGTIQISGGTLALGVSGTVNGSASAFTLDNTSGANLSIGVNSSVGSLAGGGTNGGNTSIGSGATLTVGALNTNTTYSGVISGAGALTKTGTTGTGILTLSAANTFTGNVLVSNGELQSSATNNVRSLGANNAGRTVTVASGATLKFLGNDTFGNAGSTPNPSLLISGTVTNVAGKINTLGNVTLTGGMLTNVGGNQGGYQSYSLAGSVTVNGALPSSITTTGTTFTGVHLGTNTSFTVDDATASTATDLTISAPLLNRNGDLGSTPGGLTKSGAGTLELTAANTYTGPTAVNAGTLFLSGTAALPSSAINVAGGALFDVSGLTSANFTVASGRSLSAGRTTAFAEDVKGNLTLDAGTLRVAGTGTTAGTLTQTGNLTLNNAFLNVDLAATNTTGNGVNDFISITGNLTLTGTSGITVNKLTGALTSGTYTLATCSGTLTGDAATNLTLVGLPATARQSFALATTSNSIQLVVSGIAANLVWAGNHPTTPTVWEDDGPTPMVKRSRADRVMRDLENLLSE